MDRSFEIIVAGGGISGILTASKLAASGKSVALIEKESSLGGRIKSTSLEENRYSSGLNAISDELFEFWNQMLRSNPEAPDLESLVEKRQERIGLLAASKIKEFKTSEWPTIEAARALGGRTAAKQWAEVEQIIFPEEGSEPQKNPFSYYWKKPRKSPAPIVLEHFALALGIPDIWSSSPTALRERYEFHGSRLHCSNWDKAIDALLETDQVKENLEIITSCRIVDAEKEDEQWVIASEKGEYRAGSLIVAQSPWQAALWLKKSCWPANLLSAASKSKPVSIVALCVRNNTPEIDLPDVTLVPAETAQIITNSKNEITFQATIDFELSLSAPAVVKAVKRVKRARKKLEIAFEDLSTEGEHIVLLPVGWAQSPVYKDAKWIAKATKTEFNSKELCFVGDAYGVSYNGDKNLIKSLLSAFEAIC